MVSASRRAPMTILFISNYINSNLTNNLQKLIFSQHIPPMWKKTISWIATFQTITLFINSTFFLPFTSLHRMFSQIIFDYDILFLLKIGTVRLKNKKLSFPKLIFASTIVKTSNIITVISYFKSFLKSIGHLNWSIFYCILYCGFRTPVMMKGELAFMLDYTY